MNRLQVKLLGIIFNLVIFFVWILMYVVELPNFSLYWIQGYDTAAVKFTKKDILSLTPANVSQYPRRPPYVSGMRSACLAFDDSGVALEGVSYQDLTDAQKRSVYCLPAFMILGKISK